MSLGSLRRQLGVTGFLCAWGVMLSLTVAALMVGHWVNLPGPARNAPLRTALSVASPSDGESWQLVHVLYGECRCSRRIFEYLLGRSRPAGVNEHVILVKADEALAGRVSGAGFGLTEVNPQELLSQFGVEAAPLLLVLNPDGDVVYSGGYTERKQSLGFRDLALLASFQQGDSAPGLPLFGCAVSAGLQQLVDPFGIKYRD